MKKHQILLSTGLICALFLFAFGAVSAQEGSFDIELVNQEPIFTASDVPYSTAAGGAFPDILGLRDGFFAVGGRLNTNVGISGTYGAGGQYLFDSEGSVLSIRNVADDGGRNPANGIICGHGWWNVGWEMHPVDGSSFIRDTAGVNGLADLNNPPLYYRASSNGLSVLGRAFTPSLSPDFCGRLDDPRIYDIAYAGGRVIGVKRVGNAESNVVMTLPGLSVVNETPKQFTPIIGAGDYLVAFEEGARDHQAAIYRVENNSVTKIQDLLGPEETGGAPFAYDDAVRDVSNPNRIAIPLQIYDGTQRIGNQTAPKYKYEIRIYQTGADGLTLERTIDLDIPRASPGWPLGLMGDYLAYREGRELAVEKNGEQVSVEPLPHCGTGHGPIDCGDPVLAAAFTPGGRLLVSAAAPGFGDAGDALWLYQINDFEAPTSPAPQPPTFNFTQPTLDINTFLNSAQSYINSLLQIFGTQNQPIPTSQSEVEDPRFRQSGIGTTQYTLNRPPQTIAEIRQFQCAYDIVCSGSIETTGYGNLGPLTRAKVEEIFGPQGY